MSPTPAGRGRRRGATPPGARAARKLGAVRRSQLVTTYGVGSMIAVENESFIVSGLDSWDITEAHEIWERRLARLLGVRTFRLPPAPDPDRAKDGVRAARFPLHYSCPKCQDLQPFRAFNPPPGRAVCGECHEDLVPSRFVIACTNGHLDDFPYRKWAHRGRDGSALSHCNGTLRLGTSGTTASLRSIVISCSCGVEASTEGSMEGAFRTSALAKLGLRCTGRRPWLRNAPAEDCTEQPRTMQRGSSAAWHPVVRSAISIPPWGEGLSKLIGPLYPHLKGFSDLEIRTYLTMRRTLVQHPGHSMEAAIELVRRMEVEDAADPDDETTRSTGFSALRREEYTHLRYGNPEEHDESEQDFVCEAPSGDPSVLAPLGVEKPMLVKRLREVRALESFTRVDPPSEADGTERRAPLSLADDVDWLPAIEISGEGVFLRLDTERLRHWEKLPGVLARAGRIRAHHTALLRSRTTVSGKEPPESQASPRYILLHTLAHVLVNEWSLDGGYPAAALRERLYVGLSRARDQLVVCGDPEFIEQVGGADLARRLGISG